MANTTKGFFKSRDIKVFPCTYRGKNGDNSVFNPEARLNTEANFALLNRYGSGYNHDSYIISWVDEVQVNSSEREILKVILGGYYFEIDKTDYNLINTTGKDTCLYIKLVEKNILTSHKTKVLENLNTSSTPANNNYNDLDLSMTYSDSETGEDKTEYYFVGLAYDTAFDYENTDYDYCLPIYRDGIKHRASFLPVVDKLNNETTGIQVEDLEIYREWTDGANTHSSDTASWLLRHIKTENKDGISVSNTSGNQIQYSINLESDIVPGEDEKILLSASERQDIDRYYPVELVNTESGHPVLGVGVKKEVNTWRPINVDGNEFKKAKHNDADEYLTDEYTDNKINFKSGENIQLEASEDDLTISATDTWRPINVITQAIENEEIKDIATSVVGNMVNAEQPINFKAGSNIDLVVNNNQITIASRYNNTYIDSFQEPKYNSGLQISVGHKASGNLGFDNEASDITDTVDNTQDLYVPVADATTIGLSKPYTVRTYDAEVNTAAEVSGRRYGVELDKQGRLFVCVPWKDYEAQIDAINNTLEAIRTKIEMEEVFTEKPKIEVYKNGALIAPVNKVVKITFDDLSQYTIRVYHYKKTESETVSDGEIIKIPRSIIVDIEGSTQNNLLKVTEGQWVDDYQEFTISNIYSSLIDYWNPTAEKLHFAIKYTEDSQLKQTYFVSQGIEIQYDMESNLYTDEATLRVFGGWGPNWDTWKPWGEFNSTSKYFNKCFFKFQHNADRARAVDIKINNAVVDYYNEAEDKWLASSIYKPVIIPSEIAGDESTIAFGLELRDIYDTYANNHKIKVTINYTYTTGNSSHFTNGAIEVTEEETDKETGELINRAVDIDLLGIPVDFWDIGWAEGKGMYLVGKTSKTASTILFDNYVPNEYSKEIRTNEDGIKYITFSNMLRYSEYKPEDLKYLALHTKGIEDVNISNSSVSSACFARGHLANAWKTERPILNTITFTNVSRTLIEMTNSDGTTMYQGKGYASNGNFGFTGDDGAILITTGEMTTNYRITINYTHKASGVVKPLIVNISTGYTMFNN